MNAEHDVRYHSFHDNAYLRFFKASFFERLRAAAKRRGNQQKDSADRVLLVLFCCTRAASRCGGLIWSAGR